MFILRPGILSDLTKASVLGYLGIFELFQCGFWCCYAFLCGVIFSHSRQWPHVAHFERGRLPNQRLFFTKSGGLTPMCKKKRKNETCNKSEAKQETPSRSKANGMLFF